jgi:hypothetical protein
MIAIFLGTVLADTAVAHRMALRCHRPGRKQPLEVDRQTSNRLKFTELLEDVDEVVGGLDRPAEFILQPGELGVW